MKTWVTVSRETHNMRTNYMEPKTQTGIWHWREKEGNVGVNLLVLSEQMAVGSSR